MTLNRRILFPSALPLFLLAAAALSAATGPSSTAQFTSVSGGVTVIHGKKSTAAKKDSTVKEGESVVTGKDAQATLRLFDGSELSLKPGTQCTLAQSRQTASKDNLLKFKLSFGKLLAKVQKLVTPKSSFEIEAGGVVCGVRGTQYEVDYDAAQNKVDLLVAEGNVWARAGGETFQYGSGDHGHFLGGKPGAGEESHRPHPRAPEPHDQDKMDHRPGERGGEFTHFFGLREGHEDSFKPLAGVTHDSGGVLNQASNDSLLGLGAHSVILLFKYPEAP